MEQNKTGKYLKYAIGEIVLVVIGILIALAVNQNNTDKNNNQLRDLYLIQLNDEAELNIKELIDFRDVAIKRLANLDTLTEILINKDYDNPKLITKSRNLHSRNTFNPINTTYENLKFSGDLRLFDDLKLLNSISETYNTFNHIKTVEKIDLEVLNVYYQDYYLSNARLLDLNLSSDNFGKDVYFENTALVRRITVRQIKDAFDNSIESLEKLKTTYTKFQETNK